MPSPTRRKFLAMKKAKRKQRADDAYLAAHSFFCKGQRQRRGQLRECQYEVRFRKAVEGAHATCRICGTTHIFDQPMTTDGPGIARWLTAAEHAESVPEPETVQVIELPDKKEVRIVDHAGWCSDRSKPLYGATAEWHGAGKIVWRMGGRFWHTCLSSNAASDLAHARWGTAR